MQDEYLSQEIDELWNKRGQKNSFYIDQDPLVRFHASSICLGNLNRYQYCLDKDTGQTTQLRNFS